MNFTLHLTENCNLACKYCPNPKSEKRMSEEVVYAACDLAFSKGNIGGLCFFGGEPLLEKELIYKAIDRCNELAEKTGKKTVSVYEVDDALLANSELRIREFHGVDAAWLDFVVGCRKGQVHDYDLVFGPVANDNVFVTVNLYESGVLDAQSAIARLKAYKTYNQLSFHTEKVIRALRFVESYEV